MPDMTDIAEKLLAMTREGKAPWRTTDDEETFTVSFGAFTLRLSANPKPSLAPYAVFYLSVFDQGNRHLDHIRYPAEDLTPGIPEEDTEALLPSLHQEAKRKAMNAPGRLQELMEHLDRLDPS